MSSGPSCAPATRRRRSPSQPVAARLAADVAAPIAIAGTVVRLGASIGIAVAPGDGRAAAELVRAADAAMYRAKADGRARELGVRAHGGRSGSA